MKQFGLASTSCSLNEPTHKPTVIDLKSVALDEDRLFSSPCGLVVFSLVPVVALGKSRLLYSMFTGIDLRQVLGV